MLQHLREVPIKTRQTLTVVQRIVLSTCEKMYRHCYHLQVKVTLKAPCVSCYWLHRPGSTRDYTSRKPHKSHTGAPCCSLPHREAHLEGDVGEPNIKQLILAGGQDDSGVGVGVRRKERH